MKKILRLVVGATPASRVKNWLLNRLGYEIHRTAEFGPSLIVGVDYISLGAGARVGPFNVFRDLRRLEMGESSVLGQWNWISAARPLLVEKSQGCFVLGRESALTSRHYVDASGGITVGELTTIAGVRSTFITHGIDWKSSEQTTRPIRIGSHCLISSNVAVPPGASIPDRSLIGMGSTTTGGTQQGMMWIAERAQPVKKVSGAYFQRRRGFVNARGGSS